MESILFLQNIYNVVIEEKGDGFLKLSCTNTMVPGKSLTEQAENLKNWGYEGIAVFMEYRSCNKEKQEEILKLEERTGIIPCEFAFSDDLYGHLMDPDPDLRRACRDMYREAAAVSGALGAVTELEYEYGPQNPLPLFHPYARMEPQQEEEFLQMYRELLEPLAGTEGKMLLEGINRYESPFLNTLEDCRAVTDRLNDPRAGVLADFFHMSIEEKNMAESIRKAGPAIRHVHLGDSNRLLPGYGSTDWDACLRALKEIKYEGFLNLECCVCQDPAVALPETSRYLRDRMV